MNRKALGALGEKRAGEFLKKRGYRIVEHLLMSKHTVKFSMEINWRPKAVISG